MLLLYGGIPHGLAPRLEKEAHPRASSHRRRAVAARAASPAVPARPCGSRGAAAARAGGGVHRREAVHGGARRADLGRRPGRDRAAGLPADPRAGPRLVRRLGRHRRASVGIPRAAQRDRRGRRGARMGRRAGGRILARRAGGAVLGSARRFGQRRRRWRQRGDPRVRAQARHGGRRGRRRAAPAHARGARALDRNFRRRVRPLLRRGGRRQGKRPRPLRGRARSGVLRSGERSLLRIAERAEARVPEAVRPVRRLLPPGPCAKAGRMSIRSPALAPFGVRSFRFQWPADLATSWAFEMEALILGWYVLTATGSVQQLVLFGALIWLGSLLSPFFGIAADRVGHRALLCVTRGAYAVFAALLAALTLAGRLEPWHVLAITAVVGLLKPSDMVMRQALVAQTMRPEALLGALGISRTTSDSARIAGALAGTAGVALVGMGPAYVVVTLLYVGAFLLSLGVADSPRRENHAHPLADLKSAFA